MKTPCKRMTVRAMGINEKGDILQETNGNYDDEGCRNEIGNCGCEHAETELLKRDSTIKKIAISHSPCFNCAKAIVDSNVKTVIYKEEYRLKEGLNHLKDNGVKVVKLT